MKNNKKITYILFPLVIIIWGLVIYRIFFEGKVTPENLDVKVKPVINKVEKESKRTYRLIANYRDPFLSNLNRTVANPEIDNQETENNRTTNLRRRRTTVSRVRWPQITYGGFIEDNEKQEITILLNIQDRDYLVKEGDTIEQVFIKSFYKDSLVLVYNEEEKTLIK
ncbi:MAG: hypothetical protein KQH79_12890 [Bacteroidetes bacterium]|nr:hypothetical protein [Bacteroidota bacterium]